MKQLLFVMILTLNFGSLVFAQCNGSAQYPSGTITATGSSVQTISNFSYTDDEYAVLDGITSGSTYTIGCVDVATSIHKYVTIRNGSGALLSHGPSPLTWVATVSGVIQTHWSDNATCSGSLIDHLTTIHCPACTGPMGPNELPCTATLFANGTSGNITASNTTVFTNDAADILCDDYTNPNKDSWFKLITDGDGISGEAIDITLTPSGTQDFAIYLYQGPCNSPSYVACSDIGLDGDPETINYTFSGDIRGEDGDASRLGTQFFIRVKQWGTASGNFTLAVGGVALPIVFGDISATSVDGYNSIKWETKSEINSFKYEIQSSNNGTDNWTTFETIKSENNSSGYKYQAIDKNPFSNTFYRIKAVDFDGAIQYSNIVSLKRKKVSGNISAYVDRQNNIAINIDTDQDLEFDYSIVDVTGKLIIKDRGVASSNQIFNVGENLNTGIYFIEINSASNKITSKLFINKN